MGTVSRRGFIRSQPTGGCCSSQGSEAEDLLAAPLLDVGASERARQSFGSLRTVALDSLPPILGRVQPTTEDFVGHLDSYFAHRRQIGAVYAANSVAGELEAVAVVWLALGKP